MSQTRFTGQCTIENNRNALTQVRYGEGLASSTMLTSIQEGMQPKKNADLCLMSNLAIRFAKDDQFLYCHFR